MEIQQDAPAECIDGMLSHVEDVIAYMKNAINNSQVSCGTQTTSILSTENIPSKSAQLSIKDITTKSDFKFSSSKYDDLDRPTIAKLCHFNLEPPSSASRRDPIRHNTKSIAIISWTSISKTTIMDYIRGEFRDIDIQYICI
ncbi:unnamed protein product, partial [Adineta ricciae]